MSVGESKTEIVGSSRIGSTLNIGREEQLSKVVPRFRIQKTASEVKEIHAKLRQLERRDWWLWLTSIVVMLLLTSAVAFLFLPVFMKAQDIALQLGHSLAVRGLLGVVLLFSTYAIYQQILIKQLRGEMFEMAVAAQERAVEFHQLAMFDPLTNLYNRRFAKENLALDLARSDRHGHRLSVLMLDLNNFKPINDRYGHPAGDQVLKEFSNRLKEVIRGSDLPVRMGGDEFMVVLAECPAEQVPHALLRLRGLEVNFKGEKISVTFSAGWAVHEPGELLEQLLERADQVLYVDKRAGKAEKQV